MDRRQGEKRCRSYLLGIGLDGKGDQYRVTRSEDFQILGGSERTHRRMQEQVLHLQEELARENRTIANLMPDEFEDISRFLKEG